MEVLLVLVGGLIGIVASVVPAALQRKWGRDDRRNAYDARVLDEAIRKLMAWQDLAVKIVSSSRRDPEVRAAENTLLSLDPLWEADFSLIPDQEAVRELQLLSRDVWSGLHNTAKVSDAIMTSDRLMVLQGRVLRSAAKKRRSLA